MHYICHFDYDAKLTPMDGDEFVYKLLSGEKDFRRIHVKDGFDLSGHDGFGELNAYFKETYSGKPRVADAHCRHEDTSYCLGFGGLSGIEPEERVDISGSKILHMNASGLYLPFLVARKSELSLSDLSTGTFDCSDFFGSSMVSVGLQGSRIRRCYFGGCYMPMADLTSARARGSDFSHADVQDSKLAFIVAPYSFWNGTVMNHGTMFDGGVIVGADFGGSDVSSASFRGVNAENAKFRRVEKMGAPDVTKSFFKNADFEGSDTGSMMGVSKAFVGGTQLDTSYKPAGGKRKPQMFPRLNLETGKTEWTSEDPHALYKAEALIRMTYYMNGLSYPFDR